MSRGAGQPRGLAEASGRGEQQVCSAGAFPPLEALHRQVRDQLALLQRQQHEVQSFTQSLASRSAQLARTEDEVRTRSAELDTAEHKLQAERLRLVDDATALAIERQKLRVREEELARQQAEAEQRAAAEGAALAARAEELQAQARRVQGAEEAIMLQFQALLHVHAELQARCGL